MEAASKPFDEWCLLEIMGHQKYAGRVSEAVIAGQAFIRIDIPERKNGLGVMVPGFTKMFGPGSVYSITPMSEEIARAMAAQLEVTAINIYDLPDDWREKLKGPRQLGLPLTTGWKDCPPVDDDENDDDQHDDIPY